MAGTAGGDIGGGIGGAIGGIAVLAGAGGKGGDKYYREVYYEQLYLFSHGLVVPTVPPPIRVATF